MAKSTNSLAWGLETLQEVAVGEAEGWGSRGQLGQPLPSLLEFREQESVELLMGSPPAWCVSRLHCEHVHCRLFSKAIQAKLYTAIYPKNYARGKIKSTFSMKKEA